MRLSFSLSFLVLAGWIILTVCFNNLPFYGDQIALLSHPANLFYDTHFSNLIIPDNYNTGHPPLLPVFFAIIWKIFGRSLEVSHWMMLFVILCLYISFMKTCKRFIVEKKLWIPTILFLFHPVIITQTLGMSADIFLLLFFLMGFNAVLSKRKFFFILCCTLLLLSSLRGIIYVAVLALMNLFAEKDYSLKNMLKTGIVILISAIPFIAWNIFHYNQTGWYIINPDSPWLQHRQTVSGMGLLQNTFVYIFRLAETGFIITWIFIFYFSISKKMLVPALLSRVLVLTIFFTAVLFIPYQNPILKRYFLGIECIGLIIVSSQLVSQKTSRQVLSVIILCFVFLSAHFYIYPEKITKSIGYNWDATLAATPYYSLRTEALQFLEQENIQGKTVSAGFPMYQSFYDTNLEQKHALPMVKFYEETGRTYTYFIYSNIMNGIPAEVAQQIEFTWNVVWEKQQGKIFMQVYKNPHPVKADVSTANSARSQESL